MNRNGIRNKRKLKIQEYEQQVAKKDFGKKNK